MESLIRMLFWKSVPRQLMANTLRVLFQAYRDSHAYCFSRHEPAEALNLVPYERRANIQRGLRDAAAVFGGKVKAIATRGTSNNWWSHTEVTCGNVMYTASAAVDPSELVNPAEFRQHYALANKQLRFRFDDEDAGKESSRHESPPLYCILLHGCGMEPKGELGFAVFRFPLADMSGYYEVGIDLFTEFPDVVAEMRRTTNNLSNDNFDVEFRDEDQIG